jgi:hypothetical protein
MIALNGIKNTNKKNQKKKDHTIMTIKKNPHTHTQEKKNRKTF